MMTFKEIDQRILHYEEEINWSTYLLKNVCDVIKNEKEEKELIFLENYKMKIEFFCFVTSSYIDLLCSYRNLKRSKCDWEKFYNIKIAYLIAYETINTYHKYKKEVHKTINKEDKDIYKRFFDMLNRELSEFKKNYDYDNIMSKIRNKSIAHYDKDFLTYYTSYELLDNTESKDIIRSFLYFINPLHYFTYGLLRGEIDELLFINSWMT